MAQKSVLITGCSAGGIGSALAEEFQRQGLVVFAGARNLAKMAHLESLVNVYLLRIDITSDEDVQAAVEIVANKTGGRLDYLINNAAVANNSPLLDADIMIAKQMFEANLWGHLRVIQASSSLLICTKGTIVNISSIAARLNVPWVGMCVDLLLALSSLASFS